MKSFLVASGLILGALIAKGQTDSISIKGNLKGLGNNKVSISWAGEGSKNGYLVVQGNADQFSARVPARKMPVAARLSISWPREGQQNQMPIAPFNFFLVDQDIFMGGDARFLEGIKLQGDKQNKLYNDLQQSMAATEFKRKHLMDRLLEKDKKLSAADSMKLHKELMATYRENSAKEKAFVKAHPDAFASVFLLSRMSNSYGADEYIAAWDALTPEYKNTPQGEEIEKTVERLSLTKSGTPVFDFERIDKDGKKVSTATLKGKAYILDFWGSWCGPCRASHPHLKELYKKYKSKGFEIVAIAQERGKALEDSKKSWLKAIEEDDIRWVHILNQDGIEKQNLVKTFNISAFPTKILVGADGKIITRTTSGASDAIDKALEKIYGF
jgi:thiol-disulfide isomerase/thioredoxin